ncbi:hypothetical protein GCM10011507_29370 [Edaphobacter acidisoli]|uniref:TonB-dependent transporter Oar-like beta-barrel domain-containing protein n=1 Tax=Edaphobacter acidisoli TaxID=2040573 RepID=A0A916RXU1_9BACT|nr:TonB-dependent receptor [Edaphobacter acidisoli]GGA76100.1 hypothetical protein GCM10011507_29370 [Edaphobacter acidisoli]
MKRYLLVCLLCITAVAFSQEFRATMTGRVTDSSGAIIPKAAVTVTNMDTKVAVNTTTNAAGQYTTPFLLPGKYSITVTAPGFQKFVHDNITLQTGARVSEDAALSVGSVAEEVHVSADNTLIDTQSATAGQVLTSEEIEDLPDNGRSPLGLAKTEYGVVPKAKDSVTQTRPFDNSATSDFSIGGGNSQSNELLLNGVPNMQDSSRVAGFSPSLDSVQAVRVDVFESDASYGDTSGGTVNLVTKAGTNQFHGTASEFNEFSGINAVQRWFIPKGSTTPPTRQNQYGFTLGGPVWIPKVFNGRDKLFFFYAYERFIGSTPDPVLSTVPTQAERGGDFSALLALGSSYQLYDPYSGVAVGTSVARSPLQGNIVPSTKINPVSQALIKYFPAPNVTGSPDGENNYFSNIPTTDNYNSHSGRLDWSLNDSNKIFFETHRSEYKRSLANIFNNISTGTTSYDVYQGGVVDYVRTWNPTLTSDTRASLTRSYLNSSLNSQGFNATAIGYPGYIDDNATERFMPQISFSEPKGTTAFGGLSTKPSNLEAFDTFQFFSATTKVWGHHVLKIGPDLRLYKYALLSPGSSSGSFTFGNNFMTSSTAAAAPPFGSSFASFLYGIPTGGTQNISQAYLYNSWYFSGFVQDDWRLLPSLTVNLGMRVEHETPITESLNRAVVGWDSTTANEATAPATAAYASIYAANASHLAELPPSAFVSTGGVIYATPSHRNEYNTPKAYVSPRIGISFAPPVFNNKMVVRAGFGVFVNPFTDYNTPQNYGFSATTSLVPTTDNYVTPAATLSDPFPSSNPIQQPTGSALGINTNLGSGIQFRGPNLQVPYSQRWSLDIQQQLTANSMIDIGYIGAHQVHLSYTNNLSAAGYYPYMSQSRRLDPVVQANLGQSITNPFKGLPGMTGSLDTSKTIAKYTLLQRYPEYSSIVQALVPGASATYNELLARYHVRASHGLELNVNYEYSRNLMTSQLTPGGPLTYGESTSDYPVHLSITTSYALPIGRGRSWLANNRLVDALIGGFSVNAIYQKLSGTPISWSQFDFANGSNGFNSNFHVNMRNYNEAFDRTVFYTGTGAGYKNGTDLTDTGQPSSTYNVRTVPQYFFRQDGTNNLDASVIKTFHIGERFNLEYRFEAFNVLNHTVFGAPNVSPTSAVGSTSAGPTGFATIDTISSVNRTLQQGLRIQF